MAASALLQVAKVSFEETRMKVPMIRPRLRQRLFLAGRAAARSVPCALAAFSMPLWLSPGAPVAWAQDRPDGEALEEGAPADRGPVPYRLELLVSLLQNELEADRRRLGQLAAERVRLVQERDGRIDSVDR